MAIDEKANYYDVGGIEVLAFIKAKLHPEQYKGFLLAMQIKYPGRANFKGSFVRDIEKTGIYSKLLLEIAKETCDKCKFVFEDKEFKFCPYCGRQIEGYINYEY